MAIGTTHKPIEVFGPAPSSAASRLRSLTLHWTIESSDERCLLELHVAPREQVCDARVMDTAGSERRLAFLTPLPTISVTDDPETNLVHVDIPNVLAASLEPAHSGPSRVLYARTWLAPRVVTGKSRIEIASVVAEFQ